MAFNQPFLPSLPPEAGSSAPPSSRSSTSRTAQPASVSLLRTLSAASTFA